VLPQLGADFHGFPHVPARAVYQQFYSGNSLVLRRSSLRLNQPLRDNSNFFTRWQATKDDRTPEVLYVQNMDSSVSVSVHLGELSGAVPDAGGAEGLDVGCHVLANSAKTDETELERHGGWRSW